jgi:hypothetical protein
MTLLEVPNGERQAPAKELITGSIPGAAWPLSSAQPQLNLPPNPCKARGWSDVQFLCRARGQSGCDRPAKERDRIEVLRSVDPAPTRICGRNAPRCNVDVGARGAHVALKSRGLRAPRASHSEEQ